MHKIHRNLALACEQLLQQVFVERQVLDRAVANLFRQNPRWGKRDRHFIAYSVWEVTRWKRALEFLAGKDDFAALLAVQWQKMGYEVPEWWAQQAMPSEELAQRQVALAQQPIAVRESLPDWLDQYGREQLGEKWDNEISALNQEAPVFLRANRLRTTRAAALEWLLREGVEATAVDGLADAIQLESRLPKPLSESGLIAIQDAGSQLVAPLLEVEPGMRVIDACAGAGGKTLHLAALMEGRGELWALDVKPRLQKELVRRTKPARVKNVRAALWNKKNYQELLGSADRVLIDAPCTGSGTFRRQPDLKYRLSKKGMERVHKLQQKLLIDYSKLVAENGKLVYAICSVFPEEGRGQIEGTLLPLGWEIEEERVISPFETGWDGFYAARLSR